VQQFRATFFFANSGAVVPGAQIMAACAGRVAAFTICYKGKQGPHKQGLTSGERNFSLKCQAFEVK
jgi:hypothetical protein